MEELNYFYEVYEGNTYFKDTRADHALKIISILSSVNYNKAYELNEANVIMDKIIAFMQNRTTLYNIFETIESYIYH